MRIHLCAAATLLVGFLWQANAVRCQPGGKTDGKADEQAKALMEKYDKLSDKEKVSDKGSEVIGQLKALRGNASIKLQEAIARLTTAHNLRQISIAIHQFDEKGSLPWFPLARPKWEYMRMGEGEIEQLGKKNFTAGLNQLGEEGWELATSFVPMGGAPCFIFKRQK